MNRKLKLFFLAMLGFSTACSTVKTGNKTIVADGADSLRKSTERPHIIAMYGVRPPIPLDEANLGNQDSIRTSEPVRVDPADNNGK